MAKNDQENKPEQAKAEPAKAVPPLWEIYAPNSAYSGTHPSRARFQDGVARTTDRKIAEHHAGIGHEVFDVNDAAEAAALQKFKALRAREPETAK